MKRDDWIFAFFLGGTCALLALLIHGDLSKGDFMYCIGLALGSLLGARRVHVRIKRGES